METEVRRDGWCEGSLGQQRNDGGGCMTLLEKSERVESPGTYVTESVGFHTVILLGPVLFRTALPCFGSTWRGVGCRYMMRLE